MFRLTFIFFSIFLSSEAFSWWMWTPGDSVDDSTQLLMVQGYHPDQPVPFSHKLHANDRNISCEYCHNAARRSTSAGIPPLNTCMGCHKVVNTDAEPIQYITEKYEKNEPIEWVKVHDLPDFVRFSHQVHVLAKGENGENLLQCESCHGPVKTMAAVEQWAPLQMGWCIDCHNQEKIPARDGKPAVPNASVSCNVCHY
ncbi:MAG: cytochrome C [Zetaproteobacteria bacterium]|nr:cytochrome C [Pseudobdellovibrionaceae bacterium]